MKENIAFKRNSTEFKVSCSKNPSELEVGLQLKQTSQFLKKKIGQIIKTELKTFTLRSNLVADLDQYRKQQQNKQLSKTILQAKLQAYHQKERNFRKRKYQQFSKKQKDREQKLKKFMKYKRRQHQSRFAGINQTLEVTKQRYNQISNEDSNIRLSKLALYTSQGKRASSISPNYSISRTISTSHSRHRINMRDDCEDKENHLVTNYIGKIKRSQSRIIEKQLQYEKRKEISRKQKVKCLIDQRNKQETELMQKIQRQYNQRMNTFQTNNHHTSQIKGQLQQSRSLLSQKNYKLAAKRREQIHRQALQSLSKVESHPTNLLQQFKSTIDLTNNARNMHLNLKKMREEATQAQLQSHMKVLTQKLQTIKNLKYGQKLDTRTVSIVLSMMNKNDPEYANIAEFLNCERRTYLQVILKRQQERSKFERLKKNNKAMSKTACI